MEPCLLWPQKKYFKSYLDALREHRDIRINPKHFQIEIENFPESVVNARKVEKAGKVPNRTFWLVDRHQYVGTVQLRLVAQARFSSIASNVYYDVRPGLRRRGYGTRALLLAVKKARNLGLTKLTITCESTNTPSKRIIKKCGARLIGEAKVPDRQEPVLKFELNL